MMCELLGGALAAGTDAAQRRHSQRRVHNGMLSVAVRPGATGRPAQLSSSEALAFVDWFKGSPPREGFEHGAGGRRTGTRDRERAAAPRACQWTTTWQRDSRRPRRKLKVDPAAVNAAAASDQTSSAACRARMGCSGSR